MPGPSHLILQRKPWISPCLSTMHQIVSNPLFKKKMHGKPASPRAPTPTLRQTPPLFVPPENRSTKPENPCRSCPGLQQLPVPHISAEQIRQLAPHPALLALAVPQRHRRQVPAYRRVGPLDQGGEAHVHQAEAILLDLENARMPPGTEDRKNTKQKVRPCARGWAKNKGLGFLSPLVCKLSTPSDISAKPLQMGEPTATRLVRAVQHDQGLRHRHAGARHGKVPGATGLRCVRLKVVFRC